MIDILTWLSRTLVKDSFRNSCDDCSSVFKFETFCGWSTHHFAPLVPKQKADQKEKYFLEHITEYGPMSVNYLWWWFMACFLRMTLFLSNFSNFLDNIQLYSSPLSTSNGTVQRPVPPPPPSRDGTLSRFSPFSCQFITTTVVAIISMFLVASKLSTLLSFMFTPTSPGWRQFCI